MSNIHKRGFASMTPERRAEIAALGGRTAHEKGTARVFTKAEARRAGAKGGRTTAANRAIRRKGAKA